MANVIFTASPYMPARPFGELIGRAVMDAYEFVAELRDAYVAERKAQRLARATRHLDRRLLRDIGLEHGAS